VDGKKNRYGNEKDTRSRWTEFLAFFNNELNEFLMFFYKRFGGKKKTPYLCGLKIEK
jgi:hypothetical protein